MSIDILVYVKKEKMPSPKEWQKSIQNYGFKMKMDTDFDVEEFSGFLPCEYNRRGAGFEYYYESIDIADYDEEELHELGDNNIMVTISTGSNFRELMTAVIASGILCLVAEGVLCDTGEGKYYSSNEVLNWVKYGGATISEEL